MPASFPAGCRLCAAHLADTVVEELALSLAKGTQPTAEVEAALAGPTPTAAEGDVAMAEGAAASAAEGTKERGKALSQEDHWKGAFSRAFLRVDAEVRHCCSS